MTASEAFEVSVATVRRRFHRWEMRVDGIIHAVAILAALIGAIILLHFTGHRGDARDVAAVAIYSLGMLTMFGCSAAYNLGRWTRHRLWLRNLDHVGIFLMIAGTYTPFTLLDFHGAWSWSFTGIVWSAAVVGILLRLLHGRLFDRVSLGLYLVLGWIALAALSPLLSSVSTPALILLAIGGLLYTVGVPFHLWERLPFQTVIWHTFVIAAAATHFAAVVVSIAAQAGAA